MGVTAEVEKLPEGQRNVLAGIWLDVHGWDAHARTWAWRELAGICKWRFTAMPASQAHQDPLLDELEALREIARHLATTPSTEDG